MNDFSLIRQFRSAEDGEEGRKSVIAQRAERVAAFVPDRKELAQRYVATGPLETAVDVALSVGRPLLLTGEPGSGKTLAAKWIAETLGVPDERFLEFHVKSDSKASDLRYEFDAV